MKYLPLAAVLLILLIVAVAFLIHALIQKGAALSADARQAAMETAIGNTPTPDYRLLRTDRAIARWLQIYNTTADREIDRHIYEQDAAAEIRRAITLKTLTTEARRELARDRRRR